MLGNQKEFLLSQVSVETSLFIPSNSPDPSFFTVFCRQGQHQYLLSTSPHIPTEVNLLILITVKDKLEKMRTVFDTILQSKARPHDLSHTQTCLLYTALYIMYYLYTMIHTHTLIERGVF
jgi:hypothetical protein